MMPKHKWPCGCVSELVSYGPGDREMDDEVEECTVTYVEVCLLHCAMKDHAVQMKGVPQDYGARLVLSS